MGSRTRPPTRRLARPLTPSRRPSPAPADLAEWRTQLVAGITAGGAFSLLRAVCVIALMVLGSAVMWVVLPIGWLWVGSRLQGGLTPQAGPYLLIAVGLPASMIVVAKGLRVLDRWFARLTGFDPEAKQIPLPWVKSLRDGRGSQRRVSVLDVVMLASVAVAGLAFAIWFVVVAGAPPSSVGNGGMHL